jgi:hypothetical protein
MISAIVPYTKKPAPPKYDKGYLDIEHGNIQRAMWIPRVITITSDYTAKAGDFTILADATGGAITITLPAPDQVQWLYLNIKRMNSGANAVIIDGTIDGAATTTLASQYKSVTIQSDGTTWNKMGSV